MKYAASRYTEVKLDTFCNEIFRGIDKDAVDLIDNYDGTMKEPTLLPTSFPNLLVTPNMGIAVGIASSVCPFNLTEVCDGTIALLKNPKISLEKMMDIIKAPDFPGGGVIVYDKDQMRSVFETGQGSIRIRSRYVYDKAENCIDIIQIPYSTSIEQIQKAVEAYYDISHSALIGSKRNKELMEPRHVAIWLTRELTDNTLADIGKKFGGRSHATVKHSIAWVDDLKKQNRVFHDRLDLLHDNITDAAQ
jgi:DNA gyrase/topoisomerase IV subunit A